MLYITDCKWYHGTALATLCYRATDCSHCCHASHASAGMSIILKGSLTFAVAFIPGLIATAYSFADLLLVT